MISFQIPWQTAPVQGAVCHGESRNAILVFLFFIVDFPCIFCEQNRVIWERKLIFFRNLRIRFDFCGMI